MHRDIRLLLADVDGTLLTKDKVLTDDAKAAVQALRRAGILFAVTSGRPPRGMRMLIEPLGLTGASAGFNGGVLFNPDMSVIESHVLDPAVAKKTVDLLLSRGLDAWVYTAKDWMILNPDAPHVAHETANVRFDATVVPCFTADHLAHAVKIVGISDDLESVASCEEAAQAAFGSYASAERSQPYYLDVTHGQANKGAVLATLSLLHAIPLEQIATIGDMPNDVPMFGRSGFSIAMGNASDAVKNLARAVTDDTEHEGFAKAVQRFVLQPTMA